MMTGDQLTLRLIWSLMVYFSGKVRLTASVFIIAEYRLIIITSENAAQREIQLI